MNQRIQNALTGLMFVGWAVLRVTTAETADRWTIPQLIPAAMHLIVAFMFLGRQPLLINGNVNSILWSLPSFIAGGMAINLAPAPSDWPISSQFVLAIGAMGAGVGMLFLGRSFAIFPAVRSIVHRGPFRIIRHPIYFCELVMIAGCCAAGGSIPHWGLLVLGIATVVVRIIFEERVLRQSANYVAFCQKVRFRLIPGIW